MAAEPCRSVSAGRCHLSGDAGDGVTGVDYGLEGQAQVSLCEKKSASIAEAVKGAVSSLHIKRTSLGILSWIAFTGLLGGIGGMDRETVGLIPGLVWAGVCLAVWIVCLWAGGWIDKDQVYKEDIR